MRYNWVHQFSVVNLGKIFNEPRTSESGNYVLGYPRSVTFAARFLCPTTITNKILMPPVQFEQYVIRLRLCFLLL